MENNLSKRLDKSKFKMEKVKVDIYLWEGQKFGFKIKSECAECNMVVALVRDLEKKELKNKIDVKIRPWLDNVFLLLFKRGWHAPIILVNGKVFSQGIVPNRNELLEKILH